MRLIIIILITLTAGSVMGQNQKYLDTMHKNIEALYTANAPDEYDPIANNFDRIGQAEKEQWEPFYYAALSQTFKSTRVDVAQKDAILNEAMKTLKKAAELSPGNSEIVALDGFINMMKLTVDPGTRGQTLTPTIMASFSKAIQLNPNNPRALLFMAQMQMGTAQFFGTGIEEPCKMAGKSLELFESSKPNSPIAPAWGKNNALEMQKACNADVAKSPEK